MNIFVEFLAKIVYKFGNEFIVGAAVLNVVFFVLTKMEIKKADKLCYEIIDRVYKGSGSGELSNNQISELSEVSKKLLIRYAWYANITAIFPLLGILGTVAALFTYSDVTMIDDFMVALSTTLLGVFFAIVFKGIDAQLSGPMNVIIGKADYEIQKYETKEAQE